MSEIVFKNIETIPHPYNSRIIEAYLKFITKYYPNIDIYNLLKYSGMTAYEVEDHGHWFSQDQVDKFYYRLEKKSGDKNIARKAGRYMASSEASGEVKYYFLGLMGLMNAYKMVVKASVSLTKSTTFQVNPINENTIEIVVTPLANIHEKEYQCENRIGMFEAIAELVKTNIPKIEHTECIFRGGEVCRYNISWAQSSNKLLRKVRNILIPVFLLPSFLAVFHFETAPTV